MSKKMTKPPSNRLRKVLLFILGIVGVFILLYGYVAVASLWGRESMLVDNIERKYRVYVPPSYDGNQPVPLVLVFHMLGGSGKTVEWLTHFNKTAEKEGFIVVYPDGYRASWGEGSNLYAADHNHINDVAFVSGLIDKISDEYAINSLQIYATGFSSGGMMVQRLGCELSDKITAIAMVGATFSTNTLKRCDPPAPPAVLMIHGTDDHGVPWEGNPDYASVANTVEFWVQQNKCSDAQERSEMPNIKEDGTQVRRDLYRGCMGNRTVELITIMGGGHAWPGGSQAVQLWGLNGKISQDIDASQVIWSFFQEQG